jgi:hypothetical protein
MASHYGAVKAKLRGSTAWTEAANDGLGYERAVESAAMAGREMAIRAGYRGQSELLRLPKAIPESEPTDVERTILHYPLK